MLGVYIECMAIMFGIYLQENSKRYLTMPVLPDEPLTFKSLLTETTEFDSFHDVVFHVC